MNEIKKLLVLHWQPIIAVGLGLVVVTALLWFRLGTITPALSQPEIATITASSSWSEIKSDPLYLPFKLPMFVLQTIGHDSIVALRSVGAAFGLITAVLFYILLRQWHTKRIATIGSALFITSSWFLQTSRLAAPYILYPLGIVLLCVLLYLMQKSRFSRLSFLTTAIVFATVVYIPGMVWFVVACIFWQYKEIMSYLKKLPVWLVVAGCILALAMIAPLAYVSFYNLRVLLGIFAIPMQFEPIEWIRRLLIIPTFLLARGPLDPVINLGRLPLLDIFSATMALLGIYWYCFKLKLLRTRILILFTIISVVLIMLNGTLFLQLLMPMAYIVITAGIMLLLQQWFTVFPTNPIARILGIIVIAAAISITGVYHVRRYYVAWSGDPVTRATFSHQAQE